MRSVERTTVAVLPFVAASAYPHDQALADAVTGELSHVIGNLDVVDVIAHQSMRRFEGSTRTASEIAREVLADALVAGSIMRLDADVRLSIELIDMRSDLQLWADSYVFERSRGLGIQTEIGATVARVLLGRVGEGRVGDRRNAERMDGENRDGENRDGENRDGESRDGESRDGESRDGKGSDGEGRDGDGRTDGSRDWQPGEEDLF
jgi:TolB-like protein